MYTNIGSKIKTLAKVIAWIGMIMSGIMGIAMMFTGSEAVIVGLLTAVLGVVGSWAGSFVLYGFGELVEDSAIRTEIAVRNAQKEL